MSETNPTKTIFESSSLGNYICDLVQGIRICLEDVRVEFEIKGPDLLKPIRPFVSKLKSKDFITILAGAVVIGGIIGLMSKARK